MKKEDVNEIASWLTIITSVVAAANFVLSFFLGTSIAEDVSSKLANIVPLPLLFIGFLLLEAALAMAFGAALLKTRNRGHGFWFVCFIILTIISAWVSFFNVELFFLPERPDWGKGWGELVMFYLPMTILGFIGGGLAIYFINYHVAIEVASGNSKHCERTGSLYSAERVYIHEKQIKKFQIISYILVWLTYVFA